jgi:hypothetical protein
MQITFKLDSGTEITVKPESLVIDNVKDKKAVYLGYKIDGTNVVPVMFFAGHYFTDEALAVHDKELL